MRIVLCSEGARRDMGGLGLVAVPPIARALADLGHQVVLLMYGPVIPGAETFVTGEPMSAGQGNPVGFSFPARGRYGLAPRAIPTVWSQIARADFVMLHSLYSFAVLSGFLAARFHEKKYGLWPHGVLAPFQRGVSARRKALYDRVAARRVLDSASVIFYNAEGERAEAAAMRLTAPSVIIPHGIDLEPLAHLPARGMFREQFLNGFDGPLLVYLGRLNAKKGLDVLVEAMKRVHVQMPNARLALLGTGDPPEYAKQVQAWIRQAGLDGVVFMPGLQLGRAKLAALADTDVFVLASHQENFSFAMFEAMAARVPVVISETLNFAPEVERFGAGRGVARNADGFANALLELLASPETRTQMGEAGAQLAARYSWNSVGKQMERAIQAVLSNQPLPRDLVLGQAHR